ncbi:MAG TPA: hypothetical protein VMS71_01670 [Candidatus Acidoferrum sp.]|nr:hypothetical protein [Candidatus Acidoferrum sp.]
MRKAKKAKKGHKKVARAAKRMRCAAKTKSGKACKRYTDGKSRLCSVHKR